MGVRESDTIIILKADLNTGIVQRNVFKDILEYYIYEANGVGLIDVMGNQLPSVDAGPRALKKIILCENKPDHITTDHERSLVVKGIILSEDNMKDYLRETGRPL